MMIPTTLLPTITLQQAILRAQMEEEKAKQEATRMAELEAMRLQKQMEEVRRKNEEDNLRRQLEAAGMDASALLAKAAAGDTSALQPIDRAALEKEMRDKAIKQKEQELRQRTEQARRLDYLVRALREVERAKAAVAQQKSVEEAHAYVAGKNQEALAKAQEKHKTAMEAKGHLARLGGYMKAFEDKVLEARMAVYKKKRVSLPSFPFVSFPVLSFACLPACLLALGTELWLSRALFFFFLE